MRLQFRVALRVMSALGPAGNVPGVADARSGIPAIGGYRSRLAVIQAWDIPSMESRSVCEHPGSMVVAETDTQRHEQA
jgi:hypothetical protein